MKLCLLFCGIFGLLTEADFRSLPDVRRQKRSDDIPALQVAFDQLVSRVTALEAKQAADEATISAQQSEIDRLKTMKCASGRQSFDPHGQSELVSGDYHERRHTVHVSFPQQFASTPWVAVSIGEMDVDADQNLRVNSGASAVSTTGFDAYVYEWADTHFYNIQLTWIACSV